MAAPKNPQRGPNPKKAPKRNRTKEGHLETIEKIQRSQIVNVLIDHVLGQNGREEMKPSQVTAGLGLLKKILPDQQATTLSGDGENPLVITGIERTIVKAKD